MESSHCHKFGKMQLPQIWEDAIATNLGRCNCHKFGKMQLPQIWEDTTATNLGSPSNLVSQISLRNRRCRYIILYYNKITESMGNYSIRVYATRVSTRVVLCPREFYILVPRLTPAVHVWVDWERVIVTVTAAYRARDKNESSPGHL